MRDTQLLINNEKELQKDMPAKEVKEVQKAFEEDLLFRSDDARFSGDLPGDSGTRLGPAPGCAVTARQGRFSP